MNDMWKRKPNYPHGRTTVVVLTKDSVALAQCTDSKNDEWIETDRDGMMVHSRYDGGPIYLSVEAWTDLPAKTAS